MATGKATQQTFRRALGALKDSTKVGMAKVNSDNKAIDVALVKATNHDEVLPKEKHVRTIFDALSASRPRADVAYCINALAKRLAKTRTWTVALKTLTVIHRAMREVDPTVCEELSNYTVSRGQMLNISHFKDESSTAAWEYSAWVRTYALYLEECLECYRIIRYDIQRDRARTKQLDTADLLEQLPAMQQLLFRLLACKPEGAAHLSFLIRHALSVVAAESVTLYVAITDGMLNLVDKFFEMQRHDAVRAIEIYRKAMEQAEKLSEFFEICSGLEFGRTQKYCKIEQPPASFVTAMEEYVKDAPQTLMLPWRGNDKESTTPRKIVLEPKLESDDIADDEEKSNSATTSTVTNNETVATPPIADLLCLDELTEEEPVPAPELDDKNALALSIIDSDALPIPATGSDQTSQSTGWELELFTGSNTNTVEVTESKLGGALDRSMLDRLYDAANANTNTHGTYQMGKVSSNPFEEADYVHDPFYATSSVAPGSGMQIVSIPEGQGSMMHLQQHQLQQFMVGNDPSNVAQGQQSLMNLQQHQLQQFTLGNDPSGVSPGSGMELATIPQGQESGMHFQQHQLQQFAGGNDPSSVVIGTGSQFFSVGNDPSSIAPGTGTQQISVGNDPSSVAPGTRTQQFSVGSDPSSLAPGTRTQQFSVGNNSSSLAPGTGTQQFSIGNDPSSVAPGTGTQQCTAGNDPSSVAPGSVTQQFMVGNNPSCVAPGSGMEIAATAQGQESLMHPQEHQHQQFTVGDDSTNPFGNPFAEQSTTPVPSQSQSPPVPSQSQSPPVPSQSQSPYLGLI